VDVLDHDQADEVLVLVLIVEGEAGEPGQRLLGLQVIEVERVLDRADAPLRFF
jgi:hypothetical protein